MTTTSCTNNAKKLPSEPPKKPSATRPHVLTRWLSTNGSSVGKHPLHLMTERAGVRPSVLDGVRAVVRTHYVSPDIVAQRVADLGAPACRQIDDHADFIKLLFGGL